MHRVARIVVVVLTLASTVAAAAVDKPPTVWNPASSANFSYASRTAATIDSVVIHTVEGTYAGAISWFKNPAASASSHYVISASGEITQMVADDDIAWTQAYYNSRSIGIECAGHAGSAGTWTPELVASLGHLVAWLCETYDIAVAHPTTTANDTGGWYTGHGILGHYQTQTSGSPAAAAYGVRTDPGPYFPWSGFVGLVESHFGPAIPTGLAAESWLEGGTASIHFSWAPAPGAEGYWLDIATDPGELESMTGSFANFNLTGSEHTWTGLAPGTAYFWRVFAYSSASGVHGYPEGPVSTPSFGPPAAPALVAPAEGETVSSWPVILDWNDGAGADTWEVETWRLESDGSFTHTDAGSTGESTYTLPVGAISRNAVYVWNVRGVNGDGAGATSEAAFTLAIAAPPAPTILAPKGYALVDSSEPTLHWAPMEDIGVWWRDIRLWYWTGSAWSLIHSTGGLGGADGEFTIPAGKVSESGYYWWAVRVTNPGGKSKFAGGGFTHGF